jgi:hypothetical protein
MSENESKEQATLNNLGPIRRLKDATAAFEFVYRAFADKGIILPEPIFVSPSILSLLERFGYFSTFEKNGRRLDCEMEPVDGSKSGSEWRVNIALKRIDQKEVGELRLIRHFDFPHWDRAVSSNGTENSWLARVGGKGLSGTMVLTLNETELTETLDFMVSEFA